MPEDMSDRGARELRSRLAEELAGIEDDGFTDAVMRRLRQRLLLRRVTLVSAVCIGAAVALVPALETAAALSVTVADLIRQWAHGDPSPPLVLAAMVTIALILPSMVRLLED